MSALSGLAMHIHEGGPAASSAPSGGAGGERVGLAGCTEACLPVSLGVLGGGSLGGRTPSPGQGEVHPLLSGTIYGAQSTGQNPGSHSEEGAPASPLPPASLLSTGQPLGNSGMGALAQSESSRS